MPITISPTGTITEADAYSPIATYTFPSAANSYTFTSIPGTYDDLVIIVANETASSGQTIEMIFNGDTANNYAFANITTPNGYGVDTVSGSSTSRNRIPIGSTYSGENATKGAIVICNINQYSQSSYPKVTTSTYGQADIEANCCVGSWTGTAPITSILLTLASANFQTGTRFTLYGIKRG
jgi:hypothetical protein